MANQILSSVPSKTVTVAAGDNLFNVAARELGDATKWNQISDLNPSLNGDPFITETVTLNLPTQVIATNGGLIAR